MTTLINGSNDRPVRLICDRRGNRPDALIEILRELQEETGYISDEAQAMIADALNLTRAEVRGVVSFYHDFRREPPARRVIKICRAEACQASGVDDLIRHAEKKLSLKMGERKPGARIEIEAVYCLGNCALGPAVMIGEELYGRVTPERFDRLADDRAKPKAARHA